jgi:hypothetical protein
MKSYEERCMTSHEDRRITTCDDGDARRALDEIELIHLRLLAEMSDVEDDVNERRFFDCRPTFDENWSTFQQFVESENDEPEEEVIRRSKSFGNLLSTNQFEDADFIQYSDDRRRSRSSCLLHIPDSFSSDENR